MWNLYATPLLIRRTFLRQTMPYGKRGIDITYQASVNILKVT
jgi:hypothetical protein